MLAGLLAGCGDGKTVRHIPHQGDTPYQADSILVAYGTNPQRALVLLDSALLLGNISDYRAEYLEGLSFPQYINNIRLDEALRMLRDEPEKTIAAVAAEVGFAPANLREQFKRCYGVTSAEYRAGLLEDV